MKRRGFRHTRTLRSERQIMIRMWLMGVSSRVISHATGISVSTVHRWVRRWREEGTVETRPYRRESKPPPPPPSPSPPPPSPSLPQPPHSFYSDMRSTLSVSEVDQYISSPLHYYYFSTLKAYIYKYVPQGIPSPCERCYIL